MYAIEFFLLVRRAAGLRCDIHAGDLCEYEELLGVKGFGCRRFSVVRITGEYKVRFCNEGANKIRFGTRYPFYNSEGCRLKLGHDVREFRYFEYNRGKGDISLFTGVYKMDGGRTCDVLDKGSMCCRRGMMPFRRGARVPVESLRRERAICCSFLGLLELSERRERGLRGQKLSFDRVRRFVCGAVPASGIFEQRMLRGLTSVRSLIKVPNFCVSRHKSIRVCCGGYNKVFVPMYGRRKCVRKLRVQLSMPPSSSRGGFE